MLIGDSQFSRSAVESTLAVLGPSGRQLILAQVLNSGNADYVDAKALNDCLESFFGSDSASLLMMRIKISNSRIATVA